MNYRYGCGDSGCILALEIAPQHTNGGCRCLKDLPFATRLAIERKVQHQQQLLAARDAEIARLRKERDEARACAKKLWHCADATSAFLDAMLSSAPWLEEGHTDSAG